MNYDVALKTRSYLGEGIWWDDIREALFWVDIMRKEIHCLKDGEDRIVKVFDDYVGFCTPCTDGRLAVGCGRKLLLYNIDTDETEELLEIDADIPANRFNDGKATPDGRILAGTMNNALNEEDVPGANTGRFYSLKKGEEPKILVEHLSVPNGLGFLEDGTKFYNVTDTYSQTVYAYDYDAETGEISNRTHIVYVDPKNGNPDGMTIAADGTIFVAHWDGGCLKQFDPNTGEELMKIELPVKHVTCCCFGGKDLDELYITTSSIGDTEGEYPLAGSIFVVKCGVKGRKVDRFKV